MNQHIVRSLSTIAAVASVISAMISPVHAQPAQAPASSLSGTWTLAVQGGDHVIPMGLTLDQKGNVLTGSLSFMGHDLPVASELKSGALTLAGKGLAMGAPPNGAAPTGAGAALHNGASTPTAGEFTVTGNLDAAGAFAGGLALQGMSRGPLTYTAERLRERKVTAAAGAPMASVAGDWTMKIVEAQLQLSMSLQQSGDTVTGKLVSDHLGTMTVDGTYVNGILKFVSVGKETGQEVRIEFTGKPQVSGAIAGDLWSQMGAMTWSADRVKK